MTEDIFSLAGRKAFITGGSRGIGAEIATLFSKAGAEVAICHYRDEANADELARAFEARGSKIHGYDCDVSDEEAVRTTALAVVDAIGPVDIVVNSAGIGGDRAFSDLTVGEWDRMIAVHLRGTFLVTHAFFDGMVERGWGRVINVASQLAYKGAPGLAHYAAAKAGIVGFTRALSYEGAPKGVMVNAIAPGPVETDLLMGLSEEWRTMKKAQLPIGRFGLVHEIAPTALLLASDAGAFYSGQTLSPNGGDVML